MRMLPPVTVVAVALALAGCLVTKVSNSGGLGSVTVPNTNPEAVLSAAQNVFPSYGYTVGPSNFPDSISFEKPAGGFGNLLFGSYDDTTTFRVKLSLVSIPGTSDIRISPSVYTVNDAGVAGFEDSNRLTQLMAVEFTPLLKKVSAQAANAGP